MNLDSKGFELVMVALLSVSCTSSATLSDSNNLEITQSQTDGDIGDDTGGDTQSSSISFQLDAEPSLEVDLFVACVRRIRLHGIDNDDDRDINFDQNITFAPGEDFELYVYDINTEGSLDIYEEIEVEFRDQDCGEEPVTMVDSSFAYRQISDGMFVDDDSRIRARYTLEPSDILNGVVNKKIMLPIDTSEIVANGIENTLDTTIDIP